MKYKKSIALMLSVVMLLSLMAPLSTAATAVTPTVSVQSVTDIAGATVDVNVVIENNPGILGATLTFSYDNGLTLLSATSGDAFSPLAMTKPGKYSSPCNFVWDGQELTADQIKDGVILTLQFKIDENAAANDQYAVNLSYSSGDIFDANIDPIELEVNSGTVSVIDYYPGDLNGDSLVNAGDIILLRRHVAGGYEQTINEAAADVNYDGKKNSGDIILIRRYIAGGYGVTLLPSGTVCPHNLTKTDAKAATEAAEGNIEYWSCSLCGKYYSDANGKNEITLEETLLPKLLKSEYNIQYVCDMVAPGDTSFKETDTYKPTETKVLQPMKMDLYQFLGWSDQYGNMYGTELPKGTSGDLILYANWASLRNRAVPVANIEDPIICEDSDNGQILFIYEIGKVENIPLFEVQDLLFADGAITSTGTIKQTAITTGNAQEVGKAIANTTTNSSVWTLSKDWNEVTSVSEEWAEQQGMTVEEAEAFTKSNSSTYSLSNSAGGSSSLIQSDSSSFKLSQNKAHSDSSYNEKQKYTELNVNSKIGVSNTTDFGLNLNASATIPVKFVDVGVGAGANFGNSTTIATEIGSSATAKNYTKDVTTGTDSWSKNIDLANSSSTTSSSESNWNTTQGFSSSSSTSSTQSVSKAVSELISQKHSKDSSYSTGGSEGESQQFASSNATNDSYSASVTFSNAEITINERTFQSTGNSYGAYRLVMTGTARVFAVVGYDIKNKTYYTYTQTILDDDEYKEYLDYSFDRSFTDYETSVLPFEIPIFVNDYVNSRILSSKLQINDDGIVTKYLGDASDEIVFIPSYYTRTNVTTGNPEMLKVTGIAPGLFKGNTNIVGVSLGNFINEIPESAFEGCTSLKEILCPNVMRLGANALKGCTSLSTFTLPNEIEAIGENALDGIPAVKVAVPTKELANIVANANVQDITLDISRIEADDFSDLALEVGEIETFKLIGGYKEYKGLSIKSKANHTVISGVTISDCDVIPLEVSSPNLTLERTSIHSDGFALVLKAPQTQLSLEGVSTLLTENENSIIAKNLDLTLLNEETYSAINTNGMVLICGEVTNNDGYIEESKIKFITEEEYTNYLTSRKVSFDATGGTASEESIMVPYNGTMGELPNATRDYHQFLGWYTQAEGGDLVTAETVMTSLTDITLYAHWVQNDAVWALSDEVPADAEIVDTKYTYTQTLYTDSTSATLSGWTQYDSKRTDWGATVGPVYSNPANGTRNVWSERYVKSTTKYYKYYHYWNGGSRWSNKSSSTFKYRHDEKTTTQLPAYYKENGVQFYGNNSIYIKCSICGAQRMWIPNGTETVNNYATRWYYQEPVYTYYFSKTEEKESKDDPSTSSDVSNIQKWVQYRVK